MIFVLEDMPTAMMSLLSAIRARNLPVTPCGSPAKARRILNGRWRPGDIVILDGDDGNGGTFHDCVPPDAWPDVVAISGLEKWNRLAVRHGAPITVRKQWGRLREWSEVVAVIVERLHNRSPEIGAES